MFETHTHPHSFDTTTQSSFYSPAKRRERERNRRPNRSSQRQGMRERERARECEWKEGEGIKIPVASPLSPSPSLRSLPFAFSSCFFCTFGISLAHFLSLPLLSDSSLFSDSVLLLSLYFIAPSSYTGSLALSSLLTHIHISTCRLRRQ